MSLFNCKEIVGKRKELWYKEKDIEQDKEFVESLAEMLLERNQQAKVLREELADNPHYMIEMFFIIVDKDLQVVPFFLNEVQQDFQEKLLEVMEKYENGEEDSMSFLLLKGRQQGFTSFITAFQLSYTIMKPNFSGFTIADSADNTETIFEDKCKFIYDSLPEPIKPSQKYNTKTELILNEQNSKWRCATAQAKGVGRSKTINFFHGSEVAFWRSISSVIKSLGQALTKKSIRIFESTANGFNEFRDLWVKAERGENNFIPLFYEWWKTSEYSLKIRSEEEREEIEYIVNLNDDFGKKLQWLRDEKHLSLEQLKWYIFKKKELGDDLDQEFPCTPDEAFLSSGITVFNKQILMARLLKLEKIQKIIKPIKGYFEYEYVNHIIVKDSIRFVKDEKGYITIYEMPRYATPYVGGFDTAEGGMDYCAGHVIDNIYGREVATIHKRFGLEEYARQIFCLGTYYSSTVPCLVGVETNFDLYVTKELSRLGYPKQYLREAMDSMGAVVKKLGFNTNKVSRNTILSNLKSIIKESCHLLNDIPTIKELLTFEEIDGKAQASEGNHDDLVMSLAITYFVRTQQEATIEINFNEVKEECEALRTDQESEVEYEDGFYL